MPMIAMAQPTEPRAAFPVGTVKKRMRMWGRPAVPSAKAMPIEMASSGFVNSPPGARYLAGLSALAWAVLKIWIGSQPNLPSTNSASVSTAPMSSTALMICTQVVASMPPSST